MSLLLATGEHILVVGIPIGARPSASERTMSTSCRPAAQPFANRHASLQLYFSNLSRPRFRKVRYNKGFHILYMTNMRNPLCLTIVLRQNSCGTNILSQIVTHVASCPHLYTTHSYKWCNRCKVVGYSFIYSYLTFPYLLCFQSFLLLLKC